MILQMRLTIVSYKKLQYYQLRDRLEAFVVGSDKQIHHRRQTAPNSSQWSEAWISLGAQFL
jgi:hypothetical protein